MELGRPRSSIEEETHMPTKQQRTSHAPSRGSDRGDVQLPEPQAWLPAPMLGGEPLTDDASIRDYNEGIGCHVASVLEETLLLPKDMMELRGLRRNEVFLQTKRFLGMVSIYLFTVSQQLDEERKQRSTALQTLTIAENSNVDLKQKLKAEEQAKKSAETDLKGAETQAENQRKLTNEAKEQLAASKEQVAALKQQLEEAKKLKEQAEKAKMQAEEDKAKAEKERDEAEQRGYDVGVAETEDALRAEVPAICRAYCA